jgi:hypothetical protein
METSIPEPLSLEQALDRAITVADQFENDGRRLDVLEAVRSSNDELSARAVMFMHKLATEVQEAVVRDPRFPGQRVVMLRRDNNGFSGFYPRFFGTQLLKYAMRVRSVEQAINWLQRVLSTQETTGKLIFLLWGVEAIEPVMITPTITLSSPDAISERVAHDWIREMYDGGRYNQLVSSSLDWSEPSAVLVMRTVISTFAQYEPMPEQSADESLRDYHQLKDVMLLLAVAGPCCPVLAAHWSVLEDAELAAACQGEARSGTMHEITSRSPPVAVPINGELMQACVSGFQGMRDTEQARVRTALKRIIQARMRHDLGDRAVEICTALETLAGDGENNEISHKVATRFARFLGGNLDTRKDTFKLIKAVYGIRSKMVHGAMTRMPTTVNGRPAEEAIHAATELAGKFVARVLQTGGIPNWPDFDILEQT